MLLAITLEYTNLLGDKSDFDAGLQTSLPGVIKDFFSMSPLKESIKLILP